MTLAMLLSLRVIAVILAYTAAGQSTDVPNLCPQPTASNPIPEPFYYADPDDCSHFYTCTHGKPHKMTCPPGTVWNDEDDTCVHFNSENDICTRKNAKRECDRRRGEPLLIPHLKECHKYYNCSNTDEPSKFSILREYGEMCEIFDEFDVIELKCKSYKEVKCVNGSEEATEICDYEEFICGTSHCVPCNAWGLTCKGKTDGKHEFPYKPWTTYFIICDRERVVGQHTCADLDPSWSDRVFSQNKRDCVPRAEAPTEYGGLGLV